ncbi:hypothetical protein [Shinella sp.]|uniref:hypothetical protein n=1 Tax=Shinella sp. TaxID=1870904 RepID=UPI00258BDB02|nr:hypothetical protein [Shinella sp.]MCW5706109.1 hypothetical protein [Shinella sp.]
MTVSIRWADKHLLKFGKDIQRLNTEFPKVLPRIVNQVGDRSKTQVIRALTKQTGLERRVIVAAVGDPRRAHGAKLSYEMVTRGGNIRVKYLNAKETEDGVVAKPFGKTSTYYGAFMKGGAFPNRKNVPQFNGHAFYRLNPRGTKITFVRSGVVIPQEMTSGATAAAFDKVAGPLLKERVDKAIDKLLR